MLKTVLIAACVVAVATPGWAQATVAKGKAGRDYLQAPSGLTLYVFDGDRTAGGTPSASTCYDQCAKNWPPFTADQGGEAKGDWSVLDRKDGAKQWAYKGRPLYTFVRDKTAGQQEGDAFNGNKWHVAVP